MASTQDILLASAAGDVAEVRRLLEQDAALVNATGDDDMTPLIVASRYGQREVVALLLDHGADKEAKDRIQTSTSLMWAVFYGHESTAQLLLERGASVQERNGYGTTALGIVVAGANGRWSRDTDTSAETYNALAELLRSHGGVE